MSRLITTSSLLACLQLLQVVVANLHVAVVLLQTSSEGSGVNLARSTLLLLVALLLSSQLLRLNWSSRGGRAAKHGSDTGTQGVTDGGTDSDTGSSRSHLAKQTWALLLGLGMRHRGWMWVWSSWSVRSCSGMSGSRLRSHWSGSSLSSHFCVVKREKRWREFGFI